MGFYKEILNKPHDYTFFANSRSTAYRRIRKMIREGKLVKIKKNTYAYSEADPFKLCFYLYGGFFSFSTALYLRGMKQEGEKKLYIVVPSYKKKVSFRDLKFIPVKTQYSFPLTSFINGVPVAKLERVIFDSLNIPKHADFYYLLDAIKKHKKEINWSLLKRLILKSDISTIRRAGFILEGIAPENFIKELSKKKTKGVSYLKKNNMELKFYPEWNLYAPYIIEKWKS